MIPFASPPFSRALPSPFAPDGPLARWEMGEPLVIDAKQRPPRVIRLLQSPDTFGVGILTIATGKRGDTYVFKEIACDIGGRGFVVHRLGLANVYHVRVGARAECDCECMGFLRHGRCKHIQGLSALIGHHLI
jgi:hypothetical protein